MCTVLYKSACLINNTVHVHLKTPSLQCVLTQPKGQRKYLGINKRTIECNHEVIQSYGRFNSSIMQKGIESILEENTN